VIIVNPAKDAAERIKRVAGPEVHCEWISKKIEQWMV